MSENRRARLAAVAAALTTAGAATSVARRALPPSLIAHSFQKISFYLPKRIYQPTETPLFL